jgi:DNA-binding response OmpR family regulator
LKFTPEGGSVTVAVGTSSSRLTSSATATVTASANFIELSVTDTGPGIPAEYRDKIFDRFYQVDASHTREHEGTGIGLALTKELVDLHHGEILVHSEVGRGTTFIVRLPLGKEHLKPEEVVETVTSDQLPVVSVQHVDFPSIQQSTTPSIQEPTTSDETIIIVVEDNRDVRAYIRQYLEPSFKVVEAIDGVDGVQLALEIIPDLIISDVMMPKRDGNELCRMLKTDEKTSHVPIILLTAKADRNSKVHGLEIGADDYLIKPFDSKELLARVHNLIKQRQQLRERFSREVVLKPQDIAITPLDEVFLNKVKALVEKHLGDADFEVETLSREAGMSHAQIHRKLKALTNQSASQFIRSLRLLRAVELLKQNAGTVAEITYMVGFGSQAYFTKCFHEQFGCAPKEYVKKNF